MMPRSAPTSAPLARVLGFAGLAAVAALTLADRGATRMYAWPWSPLLGIAQFAPLVALLLRAVAPSSPLALPARAWCVTAALATTVTLGAALTSPYRGASVLWSATPCAAFAGFFLLHDWLRADPASRTEKISHAAAWLAVAVSLASLALWAADLAALSGSPNFLQTAADTRNPHPLGHSNYTAGLALLLLPWPAVRAWRSAGNARLSWGIAAALVLAMLFTSGSRGGLLGLAALVGVALLLSRLSGRRLALLALGAVGLVAVLAVAHPRVRAMLRPAPDAEPNLSNIQRSAMTRAGWLMGRDRPLLGWGSGTTPLAYPRYRQHLDGGAENVLQLHSTPVQLWAELGALGLAAALTVVALAARAAPRHRVAAATLAGYAAFALTDWQLDVPVFALALATLLALLAAPAETCHPLSDIPSGRHRAILTTATLLVIACLTLIGQRDPTPEMNVRALTLARDPARTDEAIALLRSSLALNPDQEIAHFNLGWLLVVRDPAAAEKDFLAAAHLVPDKGGVYFGLGLARLNQNHRDPAARAFALECLNDPAFLASPWWREPSIAALRASTKTAFINLAASAAKILSDRPAISRRLALYSSPSPPFIDSVPAGPERTYRRERTGYPVLMRDLDLPPPTDLFDVREPLAPADPSLPRKGWLPSRVLLSLIDADVVFLLP